MYGNPYYSYPNSIYPQNNGMNWVQGEAGANAAPVAPGCVGVFFDSTRQVFYVKSVDQTGKPNALETYDYSRHEDKPVIPDMSGYVTKNEMKDEVKKYIDEILGGKKNDDGSV